MIFKKTVLKIYKKTLLHRIDPNPCFHYFTKGDFPGLLSYDFEFKGHKGQLLKAHLYYRGEMRHDRVIFFDHGMGPGHTAYLREIALIAEHGYTVFAYDHTGTGASEGEHIGGFSQSLSDLNIAISELYKLEGFENASVSVIGHSWGGFSTMTVPALHPEVTHVIPISGFISPAAIQADNLDGFLKHYRKAVLELERSEFPELWSLGGIEALKSAKSTRALIIHSEDDPVVKASSHFEVLRRSLAGAENVEFMLVTGKMHNPHYTKAAVDKKDSMSERCSLLTKKKKLRTKEEADAFKKSYDWLELTEQDPVVWDKIFAFLES